jgi:hypothetical protein
MDVLPHVNFDFKKDVVDSVVFHDVLSIVHCCCCFLSAIVNGRCWKKYRVVLSKSFQSRTQVHWYS